MCVWRESVMGSHYSQAITCPRRDLSAGRPAGRPLCCVNICLEQKTRPLGMRTQRRVCTRDVGQKNDCITTDASLIWRFIPYAGMQTLPYRCPEGLSGRRLGRIPRARCNSASPEQRREGKISSRHSANSSVQGGCVMVGESELEVRPKDLDFQIVFRHVMNIKLQSCAAKCCRIDFFGGGGPQPPN